MPTTVDGAEPRRQPGDLDRPFHLARRDRSAVLRAERRQREADGGEIGAGVERVAELLEQDRLLDEAEPDAAVLLRDRHAEPAELRELAPAIVLLVVPISVERVALLEPCARLPLQLELLFRECEVHQRPFGRPRTRSATMLRALRVPASIVLPRLRTGRWCHQPSSRIPSGPSSRPSFVRRRFCSDQRSSR